ncbi:MAG: glycoside hydrolase family 2 protein [Clostridiales bacterium]|nr:glycoside hydrolase family 2 protein [Clostridiales bacterium]
MRIDINDGWIFNDDFSKLPEGDKVRIPHTVTTTPLHYFDEAVYQKLSGYIKYFDAPAEWKGKRLFLTFEGVAHEATVYVNGLLAGVHSCGYTAFTYEITDYVNINAINEIKVQVDSRETLNIPPFGFVIDYMTYGGIYREVSLEVKEQCYIKDVFVRATAAGSVFADVTFDGGDESQDFGIIILEKESREELARLPGKKGYCAISKVPGYKKWDINDPMLYILRVESETDVKEVVFGFRDSEFRADGYYLNGKKVTIMGLNRHQSYPYVGYAMPKSMQAYDADILKYELGVNAVRTSHYPQSRHFLDRCDEIGLLVFTEIPGWQHIGDEKWKDQAVKNVEEMVLQYRNHPSIILWGVRINESVDDDEFYRRTNETAHKLDSSRPTSGVRYLKKSSFLEDVYAYNDFLHDGKTAGCEKKKNVSSDMKKPYLISEYNGHMYPTKTFDSEDHRTEHMIRHANVIDAARGEDGISGTFGWCMFDYNTHKDFGSGDRICYHGVMDMFRNPKLAASIYSAAGNVDKPFLEISSEMNIGEHPSGNRGNVYIITNCDSVRMYKNDLFIKEYTHSDSSYKNLPNAPILIDDYIGDQMKDKEGFTDRQNQIVRDALNYIGLYGMNNIPPKIMLKLGEAMARYRMTFQDAYALYGKYIGDWGGKSTEFKFIGIKDGKEVITKIKSPCSGMDLDIRVSSFELHEGPTYDVASVRIRVVDQNGNVLPFYNGELDLETEGPIRVVGPKRAEIRGGMGGVYVKTTGKLGEASLKVYFHSGFNSYDSDIIKEIRFEVSGGVNNIEQTANSSFMWTT